MDMMIQTSRYVVNIRIFIAHHGGTETRREREDHKIKIINHSGRQETQRSEWAGDLKPQLFRKMGNCRGVKLLKRNLVDVSQFLPQRLKLGVLYELPQA
jgi:hypothetical protein